MIDNLFVAKLSTRSHFTIPGSVQVCSSGVFEGNNANPGEENQGINYYTPWDIFIKFRLWVRVFHYLSKYRGRTQSQNRYLCRQVEVLHEGFNGLLLIIQYRF